MPRFATMITLLLVLPGAHAVSLKEQELGQLLNQVAQQSSVGTPRAINADILDQGYTVKGTELVNHLSVRPAHAEQMRANPDTVRAQLANSVCGNAGYRQLLQKGAVLRYQFSEFKNNRPIATERFSAADCPAP